MVLNCRPHYVMRPQYCGCGGSGHNCEFFGIHTCTVNCGRNGRNDRNNDRNRCNRHFILRATFKKKITAAITAICIVASTIPTTIVITTQSQPQFKTLGKTLFFLIPFLQYEFFPNSSSGKFS